MRPRLLTAFSVALMLTLLGPTGAAVADDPHEVSGPSLPDRASDTAKERATEALDEAQALFEEKSSAAARRLLEDGGPDATMVLNQLKRLYDDLSASEREQADSLLARPTDGAKDPFGDGYRVRQAKPHCGGAICVHYVRKTKDAPPLADADRDGVPNTVEQTLQIARRVHGLYTNAGYRRPDSDGRRGGRRKKVDIYLANVGRDGLYGYCTSDQPQKFNGTKNYWAYCVIDDDFSRKQFPSNTPQQNRKVTIAHEYFHAVQFAYDFSEDPWFMEATATWVEDETYDGINDNRQFLETGQLGWPDIALDRFGYYGNHYGNWIFFRYLTERWPEETGSLPTLVLESWRGASGRTGAPDKYSTQAVADVIEARGGSFDAVYGDFAAANRDPVDSYDEGEFYEGSYQSTTIPAPRWRTDTLGSTTPTVSNTVTVNHLASETVGFRPSGEMADTAPELTIEVDLPDKPAQVARLVVHRTDGTIAAAELTETDPVAHVWTATIPFDTADVTNVELVVGNASYAPRMNDLETAYTATLTQNP